MEFEAVFRSHLAKFGEVRGDAKTLASTFRVWADSLDSGEIDSRQEEARKYLKETAWQGTY